MTKEEPLFYMPGEKQPEKKGSSEPKIPWLVQLDLAPKDSIIAVKSGYPYKWKKTKANKNLWYLITNYGVESYGYSPDNFAEKTHKLYMPGEVPEKLGTNEPMVKQMEKAGAGSIVMSNWGDSYTKKKDGLWYVNSGYGGGNPAKAFNDSFVWSKIVEASPSDSSTEPIEVLMEKAPVGSIVKGGFEDNNYFKKDQSGNWASYDPNTNEVGFPGYKSADFKNSKYKLSGGELPAKSKHPSIEAQMKQAPTGTQIIQAGTNTTYVKKADDHWYKMKKNGSLWDAGYPPKSFSGPSWKNAKIVTPEEAPTPLEKKKISKNQELHEQMEAAAVGSKIYTETSSGTKAYYVKQKDKKWNKLYDDGSTGTTGYKASAFHGGAWHLDMESVVEVTVENEVKKATEGVKLVGFNFEKLTATINDVDWSVGTMDNNYYFYGDPF